MAPSLDLTRCVYRGPKVDWQRQPQRVVEQTTTRGRADHNVNRGSQREPQHDVANGTRFAESEGMNVFRVGLIALLASACGSVSSQGSDAGADASIADSEPSLIPSTVFVTSSGHSPDFGSRQDADSICNDLATREGLTGNYLAWLSEGASGAASRLPSNRRWHRVDGVMVADGLANLVASNLAAPVSLDETGAPIESSLGIYTGTQANGQPGASSKCGNWTALSTESVLIGEPTTDGAWTESDGNCGRSRQLYCFEI